MTLAEILANKELGDDQEITLGEDKFKLGDLRGVASERETFRAEREAIAKERDDYRGKHDSLSASISTLLGAAGKEADREIEHPEKAPQDQFLDSLRQLVTKDDGTDALFQDKVFGGALTKVEERAYARAKKDFDSLKAELAETRDSVKQGFEGLTRAQLSERAERWYDVNRSDIPKGEDGKRMSLKAVHEYAMSRNFVRPGTQILDYDAALEALTEPTRVEARMTEAEKRGYEKGLEQGRAQAGRVIPMFGDRSAGGGGKPAPDNRGKSARQIMEEAVQRGLNDAAAENE